MRSLKDRLCRPRLAGGFTLVELLIAFVLVALISLLLFSGLRLGLRSWGGVEAAAEIHADDEALKAIAGDNDCCISMRWGGDMKDCAAVTMASVMRVSTMRVFQRRNPNPRGSVLRRRSPQGDSDQKSQR